MKNMINLWIMWKWYKEYEKSTKKMWGLYEECKDGIKKCEDPHILCTFLTFFLPALNF